MIHRLLPAFAVLLLALGPVAAAAEQRAFAGPEDAATALFEAYRTNDVPALRGMAPEAYADAIAEAGDPGAAARRTLLAEAADRRLEILLEGEDRAWMLVGFDAFPYPVPLARTERGWVLDAEEGADELLARIVGWNELTTISVLQDYVDAQVEYASEPRDGTRVRKFATRFLSSPGKRDGLYWEEDPEAGIGPSPFGPVSASSRAKPEAGAPYYGYRYRILTGQGEHAPGGAYSYVIHGNLVAGFAAVAWPDHYGASGVMTFLVNHYGTVYQKDLGADTAELVEAMTSYDPDDSWKETDADGDEDEDEPR